VEGVCSFTQHGVLTSNTMLLHVKCNKLSSLDSASRSCRCTFMNYKLQNTVISVFI
jgi:hypothetical protein